MRDRAISYLHEDKFYGREQQDRRKYPPKNERIELTRAEKRSYDPACDGRGDPEPNI